MFSLSINQETCSDLQVETIEPKVLTADNIFSNYLIVDCVKHEFMLLLLLYFISLTLRELFLC